MLFVALFFLLLAACCLLPAAALLPQPRLPDSLVFYPQPMRWHSEIAAGLLFHAAVANAFTRCLGRLPQSPTDGTTAAAARHRMTTMSTPLPGLFGRKAPHGLGSWRVESVVDCQEPNSMFVFLFDDGSGEGWWCSGRSEYHGLCILLSLLSSASSPPGCSVCGNASWRLLISTK